MTGSAGDYAGFEPGMVRNRRVPDWLPTVEAGEDAHSPAGDNRYHCERAYLVAFLAFFMLTCAIGSARLQRELLQWACAPMLTGPRRTLSPK